MNAINFAALLGGLGLFLYGMDILSESLERAAGDRLQQIIETLTGNIYKGLLMGTIVTALIQSSSATTVMVVGFVNAGIMSLSQSVGVIMGANIGTTVTTWIISLGDLSDYFVLLKPQSFAPIFLAIGVVITLFFKKEKRVKELGGIFVGFGLLFIGMLSMEQSVESLKGLPQFQAAFSSFENPIIGVLAGLGITAIIQSSSASIGILQAAAAMGMVTFSSAVPIIMGQNIGTCVTALISSTGANKNARRAAVIHLLFNLIGTTVLMVVLYTYKHFFVIPFWEKHIIRSDIALFHTLFNIANTAMLLPFSNLLVFIANKAVPGKDEHTKTKYIDERFLSTPSLALSQTIKEIVHMGEIAHENVVLTSKLVLNKDKSVMGKITENEETIDTLEIELTNYLAKVADHPISTEDSRVLAGLFHTINDIERIGDHAMNIMELTNKAYSKKVEFSETAMEELANLYECIFKILELSINSQRNNDIVTAHKVEPLEEVIDELIEKLKDRHMGRLSMQECNPRYGFVFLELLTNFERIGDHCLNIAVEIIQRNDKNALQNVHRQAYIDDDYKKNYEKYLKRYGV
ncbi:MAG: Na/Pi cotransporter family protein [Firmicutes bacterium]|nr:Na/Pi cotransporter family protein [Bacillota bacterium]